MQIYKQFIFWQDSGRQLQAFISGFELSEWTEDFKQKEEKRGIETDMYVYMFLRVCPL